MYTAPADERTIQRVQ